MICCANFRRFYLICLGVLMISSIVRAADQDKFTLTITPYAWFPGISGKVTVRGISENVSESFLDLVDQSDTLFGFYARAEAHVNKFGAFVDGGWSQLGADVVTQFGGGELTQTMGLIDFGLMYRVIDLAKTDYTDQFTIDATVGGRYWH